MLKIGGHKASIVGTDVGIYMCVLSIHDGNPSTFLH